MNFFTENGFEKPGRISEKTKKLAAESLALMHRLESTDKDDERRITVDSYRGFDLLDSMDKYDRSVRLVAENAPVIIQKNELISGSVSLSLALDGFLPVVYAGNPIFRGIDQLTVDFEKVLKKGIAGIRLEVLESLKKRTEPRQMRFLQSCLSLIDSLMIFRGRYLEKLSSMPEFFGNYQALVRVPFESARTFREALYSIHFTYTFLRLLGNRPSVGRLDALLSDYLENDLENGDITLAEAKELLAHFFIKGCDDKNEAIHSHGVTLSGRDKKGNDVTNAVTYLILEIAEELPQISFPISVRISSESDRDFLRKCADVISQSGRVMTFCNEDLAYTALRKTGYNAEDVHMFVDDGNHGIRVEGKTSFLTYQINALEILEKTIIGCCSCVKIFKDFNELYSAFSKRLESEIDKICSLKSNDILFCGTREQKWRENTPCTAVSLFIDGCIRNAASYLEGGPAYNVCSPKLGGFFDTVNSLYAIKKIIFDKKYVTLPEFVQIIRKNWEGNEFLQNYSRNKLVYYCNDNDECDEIASRIISDLSEFCKNREKAGGYFFSPCIVTFGRSIVDSRNRLVGAQALKLATDLSPTTGGATAAIRSFCKSDLKKASSGAVLDLEMSRYSLMGDDGGDAIVSLLMGFTSLGGYCVMPHAEDDENSDKEETMFKKGRFSEKKEESDRI